MRGRFFRISGWAGFLLLAVTALRAFPPISTVLNTGLLQTVSPLITAGLGLLLVLLRLMTCPGYRRFPFWLAVITGSGLICAPLAGTAGFLHGGVLILTGTGLLLAGRVVMRLRNINSGWFSASVAACTFVSLFLPLFMELPSAGESADQGDNGELEDLLELLRPAPEGYDENLAEYVEELVMDERLSREEQEHAIEELNERIEELEGDLRRFESARDEQEMLVSENARLRELLEQEKAERPEADDLEMVTSYREAVRPAVPLVRDFAVNLASVCPGSYYRSPEDAARAVPGKTGVLQVAAIHRYVFGEWKYVNDSLVIPGEYYSPADRTIALGLAGDCDDFAILLASCVEAIRGRARIMHGRCSDGGHAWCEMYIGDERAWNEAIGTVKGLFPGRRISWIVPGRGQGYWLCLDWEIGVYFCGRSPVVAYASKGGY